MQQAVQEKNVDGLGAARKQPWFRVIVWVLLFMYSVDIFGTQCARAQSMMMPPPSEVLLSAPLSAVPIFKGISLDPADPFKIDFVVEAEDRGKMDEEQSKQFIRYFLTFLTIPAKDLWVNLSPAESDRIVNTTFGETVAGKEMLVQDYLLKQLAASMTNPERELGKKFWEQVYAKVREQYGDVVDVPLDAVNKVWVMPEHAVVYEKEGAAFIGESRLKVMLDEDYASLRKIVPEVGTAGEDVKKLNGLCSKITREIIIPEIEREVNEGATFVKLRQMYHALILAIWFKRQLQASIVNQLYAGKKKIDGVDTKDTAASQRIYGQYMTALKKGAYDMIREEYDPATQETVPRRYFSGGFSFDDAEKTVEFRPLSLFTANIARSVNNFFRLTVSLIPKGISKKLLLYLLAAAGSFSSPVQGGMLQTQGASRPVPQSRSIANTNASVPLQSVKAAVLDQPYVVAANVVAVPDEMHLTAGVSGVIGGLERNKKEYKAGDVVMTVASPEVMKQREEVTRQLSIQEETLLALKGLEAQGAAAASEVAAAEEKTGQLRQQIARVDQEGSVESIKAPSDLSVKEVLVLNGMTVNKGTKVLDYFNGERVRINVDMPTAQAYFGRIAHFKINGTPVKHIVSVDWRPDLEQKHAVVSFVVIPAEKVPANAVVDINAEILPPLVGDSVLGALEGQAHTVAFVRAAQEEVLVAPLRGPVKFHVAEGDRVVAGQLLAEVNTTAYLEEYRTTVEAFNNVSFQLEAAAVGKEGMQHISRSQADELRSRLASLRAQVLKLQIQIARSRIIAPENGIITQSAFTQAASFHEGDTLLVLRTDRVSVGDINNMNAAILLPADLQVQTGDPVLVETSFGVRIPARVVAVNGAPVGKNLDLGRVQAVEVLAYDAQGILWPQFPVKVIVPAEAEKPAVEKALAALESAREESLKERDQVLEKERPRLVFEKKAEGQLSGAQMASALLRAPGLSEDGKMTVTEVSAAVAGNNLLNGELQLDVLQRKAAEKLPHSFRLALQGGIFVNNNGSLAYSGGLNTVFEGISAGVATGNAIGAASPLVFNVAGQMMDLISGKKLKEKELAVKMTQIAQYHMQTAVAGQVKDATDLFIEVGRAQQHIVQLESLTSELKAARQGLIAREVGGFTVTADRNALTQKIEALDAELLQWRTKEKQTTIELNQMMKRPAERLQEPVSVKLLWNGEFPTISEDGKNVLLQQLTGKESANYQLRGAETARLAIEETIRLQGLEYLPSADLTGLYIKTPGGKPNPLYGLVPSQTMSTSALTPGANGAGHFELPLIDTGRKTRKEIARLQREKVLVHLESVKADLNKDLNKITSEIQDLNRQIQEGERDHQDALGAWLAKASRADLYRKDQLVVERQRVEEIASRLIDLKAAYFKAEARLRSLQLMEQDQSLVKPSQSARLAEETVSAHTEASNVSAGNMGSGRLSPELPVIEAKAASGVIDEMSAGSVVYPAQGSDVTGGAGLWSLMGQQEKESVDGARLSASAKILVQDPNIAVRRQALNSFKEEFQNDGAFQGYVEEVLLNSSYPDVRENLLQFMADQDGHNVRFLAGVLSKAMDQGNTALVGAGFQMLGDLLIQDPDAVERLAGVAQMKGGTDPVRRVMLTFLVSAPEDSIVRTRLLQSEYWTEGQLAEIYNTYRLSSETSLKKFSRLVYDEIFRREALHGIEDAFSPGPFANLSSMVFEKDLRTIVMLRQWSEADKQFLTASPRWREMKAFISPDLYKKAKKAADGLVSAHHSSFMPTTGAVLDQMAGENDLKATGSPYFNALQLSDQKRFIARTSNIPELARIFSSSVSLRGMALDRLMEIALGRAMVLEVYTVSGDEELLRLVESRNWIDVLQADIKSVNDPVINNIYRDALEKMSERSGDEVFLNIRLKTYSLPELHQVKDPRGKAPQRAQINMNATRLAVELVAEDEKHQGHWFSGQSNYSPKERAIISELEQKLNSALSPEEVNTYLTQLKSTGDSATKKIVRQIEGRRDGFAHVISSNDQSVPLTTMMTKTVIAGLIGLFGWIFLKSRYKDAQRKASSIGRLIHELRKDFSVQSGNGKAHIDELPTDIVIINQGGLNERVYSSLQNWRSAISQWRHSPAQAEDILSGLNVILNNAFDILYRIPYKTDLVLSVGVEHPINSTYQKALQYFNLLAIDTLNVINDRLKNDGIRFSDYEREKLLSDIRMLEQLIEYTNIFLRVLEFRGNIDKVMGYKFSDEHWAEKSKIYPSMREILGQGNYLRQSEALFNKEMSFLLHKGNELMPSLYLDPDTTVQKSRDFLSTVIKNADNVNSSPGTQNANDNSKMGRFLRRLLVFMTPVLGVAEVITGGPVIAGFSVFALGCLALRVGVEWDTAISNLNMPWSKTMTMVSQKLLTGLQKKLSADAVTDLPKDEQEKNIRLALKDGMAKLQQELSPGNERSVDMIIMLPENGDADDVKELKQYVDSRRGTVFRQDVPVEVLSAKQKGSGNAYLEAVQAVKDSYQNKSLQERYPHLKDVAWEDLRVMFVFTGIRELRSEKMLDWSVINGYRASSCGNGPCFGALPAESPEPGSKRGGHMLIYSRDAYFGPLQLPAGDIGILGNWVDQTALKGLGLLNIVINQKWSRVKQILEKLNIADMQAAHEQEIARDPEGLHPRGAILDEVYKNFILNNSSLKQYPAVTGVMFLGPKVVQTVTDVLQEIEKRPGTLKRPRYFNFTNDILNILLKPESDVTGKYIQTRLDWADIRNNYGESERPGVSGLFQSFYKMFLNAKKQRAPDGLAVNTVVPYPGGATLIHISNKQDLDRVDQRLGEYMGSVRDALSRSSSMEPQRNEQPRRESLTPQPLNVEHRRTEPVAEDVRPVRPQENVPQPRRLAREALSGAVPQPQNVTADVLPVTSEENTPQDESIAQSDDPLRQAEEARVMASFKADLKEKQDGLKELSAVLKDLQAAITSGDISGIDAARLKQLKPYVQRVLTFAKEAGMSALERHNLANTLSGWVETPGLPRRVSGTPWENFSAGILLLRENKEDGKGFKDLGAELSGVMGVIEQMIVAEMQENEAAFSRETTVYLQEHAPARSDKDGGLDFMDTENVIRFEADPNSSGHPASLSPERVGGILQFFRGFDFKIISLQPFKDQAEYVSLLARL